MRVGGSSDPQRCAQSGERLPARKSSSAPLSEEAAASATLRRHLPRPLPLSPRRAPRLRFATVDAAACSASAYSHRSRSCAETSSKRDPAVLVDRRGSDVGDHENAGTRPTRRRRKPVSPRGIRRLTRQPYRLRTTLGLEQALEPLEVLAELLRARRAMIPAAKPGSRPASPRRRPSGASPRRSARACAGRRTGRGCRAPGSRRPAAAPPRRPRASS